MIKMQMWEGVNEVESGGEWTGETLNIEPALSDIIQVSHVARWLIRLHHSQVKSNQSNQVNSISKPDCVLDILLIVLRREQGMCILKGRD